METEYAVLLGAIIGGAISVITNWIQQKSQMNRDLTRIAFEMAVKEYDTLISVSRDNNKGQSILPFESFVTYYIEYLKVVRSKKYKIKELEKLRQFRKELNAIYK